MFKQAIAAVALAAMFGAANAAGVVGGVVIGGGAEVVTGSVAGTASINGQTSTSAGSLVIGSGTSYQHSDAITVGQGYIGGTVGANATTINSANSSYATIHSAGTTTGGAPDMQGSSIANGTTGFAETNTATVGTGTFNKVAVGAVVGIGGIAGVSGL